MNNDLNQLNEIPSQQNTDDMDMPFPETPVLQAHEKTRFDSLEKTVQDGLRDFKRTGKALSEIRDNEFFKETHDTFEAYLEERWGFTPTQAGRLIDAADVAKVLEPIGIEPQNEQHARKFKSATKILTELEPEQQRMVARIVEDVSPEQSPEAPELKIMANVVQKMEPETTVYHPENGDEVPFDTLSPPQRYDVIREHVNQKTQAYHEKQAAKEQNPPAARVNWADWCMNYAAQNMTADQRLEIVVEQDASGNPKAQARVMDKMTGEILAEGNAADFLKKAVMSLVKEVK